MFAQKISSLDSLLTGVDPAGVTRASAEALLARLSVHLRVVQGVMCRLAARVAVPDVVARATGVGVAEARRAMELADALVHVPEVDAAVRQGVLTTSQAGSILEAVDVNPGAVSRLLDAASDGPVALRREVVKVRSEVEDDSRRAARQHARRFLKMWTSDDGMLDGRFSLPPEQGARLKTVLDAEVDRVFRTNRTDGVREPVEAYAADALVNLMTSAKGAKGPRTSVHVVIDRDALLRGNTLEGERCEIPGVGPVNAAWVRGMLGDAFVTFVIANGKDIHTVVHAGRHIPAEIKTALLAGKECAIEGRHTNIRDPVTGKRTLTEPARAG
jgi:hypothetical protein